MGLRDWYVRRKLREQLRLWQIKVDAERERLAGEKEGGMPVWLHTLLVIFAGGALGASADAIANGFTADEAGLRRLAGAALAGGLIAIVGWLKQSPVQPGQIAAAVKGAVRSDVSGKLLLLGLLPLVALGCVSASGPSITTLRPKGIDFSVVKERVCAGHVDEAEKYVLLRGGGEAEQIELVSRARKACPAGGK